MLRRCKENCKTLQVSVCWLAVALLGSLPQAACDRASPNADTVNASIWATGAGARHTVQLRWNPSSSSDIRTYRIYRGSKSGGPYSLVGITPGDEHTFVDDKVQSGSTCFYVVKAVNQKRIESTASNEVRADIPSR
jgi:type IV secretory pathway protease TraF